MKSLIATAQPSLYMSVICVCGRTAGKTISCESHSFPTSQRFLPADEAGQIPSG